MKNSSGILRFCHNFNGITLEILIEKGKVILVRFAESCGDGAVNDSTDAFAARVVTELEEYFSGRRKSFTVPIELRGTSFQNSVWNALLAIPYGQTRSYKEIAEAVGNEKAARAVGMACNRNPVAIIVPCHRVVGANGSLTGYAGGLQIKRFLLELEEKKHDLTFERSFNYDKYSDN